MTPPKNKAADRPHMLAYIRVSRVGERGGTEGYDSPGDQRRAIERWAEYEGVEIVDEYVDEDQSGGTQERPGLEAAINRALAGEVNGIVTYDISRFSRNTEGGLRDLRRLEEKNARLAFTNQRIDTSTPGGKMVYTIMQAAAEAQLAEAKARWLVTKERAIEQGRQIGPTPDGYTRATTRNGRPKGQLVPDKPTVGPAVTAAYKAVAKHRDIRASLPILQEGIPTKTFTVRKRSMADYYGVEIGDEVTVPATWNTTTARRLLKQRVYLGWAYYGNGKIKVNHEAHEPLIDGTTWRAVQRIIGEQVQERTPAASFPLSGIVTCATCRRGMVGTRLGRSPGERGYKCTTNQIRAVKRNQAPRCEQPASIMAGAVEVHARELLLAEARAFEDAMEADPSVGWVGFEISDDDLPPELEPLQDAVIEAEEQLAAIEAMELPEAAKAAALEAQDVAVSERRQDLERAREEHEGEPSAGYIEPWEIAEAPAERLPELLSGMRVVVEPAFGRRGRVPERVSLEREDGMPVERTPHDPGD